MGFLEEVGENLSSFPSCDYDRTEIYQSRLIYAKAMHSSRLYRITAFRRLCKKMTLLVRFTSISTHRLINSPLNPRRPDRAQLVTDRTHQAQPYSLPVPSRVDPFQQHAKMRQYHQRFRPSIMQQLDIPLRYHAGPDVDDILHGEKPARRQQ